MKKMKSLFLSGILTILTILNIANAQPPGTLHDSLFSHVMNEQRNLLVQLPEEFKPGMTQKYQVLYLLDGEWNSGLVAEVQHWLKSWGFTTPLIIVGISNTYANGDNQRSRDLTPTHSVGLSLSGGGPAFLSFIKNELIPYINNSYPSNGDNILFGHSLGGLFVLYTLFSEPQLFNAYIAADPSIWWDQSFMLKLAKKNIGMIKTVKSLFITGRTGNPYHEMRIDSMEMLLKKLSPPTLQWKAVAYPDETHISQQYKSAYDGLKYSIAPSMPMNRISFDPKGGIVLKGQPFEFLVYNNFSDKYIRYTLNDKEPTMSSTALQSGNKITLQKTSVIKIKSFFADSMNNNTDEAHFSVGTSLPVTRKRMGVKQSGLNFTCFSDSIGGHQIKAGIIEDQTDINHLVKADSFFTRITGYLETVKKGYYVFELSGPPGTRLFVGEKLLLKISDQAATRNYQSFIIPLEKGFYPIRFQYVTSKSLAPLDFSYVVPGGEGDEAIPITHLYYTQ